MSNELSATVRDYLAKIYRLSEHNRDSSAYVSTSALAELMDVSPPAVNRMISRLKEMGLLNHEPYQGINLTEQGRKASLMKLRKHRIAEAFLVNVMGFDWTEIYEEAHRMSNAMSDAVTQRMLEMAESPAFCPHGEPIPSAEGELPELDDIRLSDAQIETPYVVTRVLTREPDRLKYIEALGLLPGTPLNVIHIAPFNGPMQLHVGAEYRIIGHNLAELLKVKAEK